MKYVPYAVQSWVVGPKLDDILVAVLEMATSAECEIVSYNYYELFRRFSWNNVTGPLGGFGLCYYHCIRAEWICSLLSTCASLNRPRHQVDMHVPVSAHRMNLRLYYNVIMRSTQLNLRF